MRNSDEIIVSDKELEIQKSIASNEIVVQQTKALQALADGIQSISRFLNNGGLTQVLSGYARSQSVQGILSGLAGNMGRSALDAKTIRQNALEITEVIEAVFDKYAERLASKADRDPEIHDEQTKI